MRIRYFLMALVTLAVVTSCKNTKKKENKADAQNNKEVVQEEAVVYEATINPLNAEAVGTETTGKARFVVKGDSMKVTIDVKNAPAGIAHWQHFHGFKDGKEAKCPTADADKNGDGIVDLMETHEASGKTMVPFNKLPAKMKVAEKSYPKADDKGSYHYEVTVPVKDLKAAFAEAFGGAEIALDKRVLYIHGVPAEASLPKTVASLGDIPAQVTIPIACGEIHKVK